MPEKVLLENQAAISPEPEAGLRLLPGYAAFVRDNYLVPYVQEQIHISRRVNLPMLRFFSGIPDDELLAMSMKSNGGFLTAIEENRVKEQLEKSLEVWVADQMGVIKREEIMAEDIILAGYIRKQALMKFLPGYTSDVHEAIEIIKEIDAFTVEADTAATNVYIRLLKNRISEQAHFTETLSNTTPGLNYIYSLGDSGIKYVNRNAELFFGKSQQELEEMGSAAIGKNLHPGDVEMTNEQLAKFTGMADGEVTSWEMRLRHTSGRYIWMRNYASVFRRDGLGVPVEIVGIILDVAKEKEIADKLLQREKQLIEAQSQAKIGSFELDVETGAIEVTPQFKEIYEVTDVDISAITGRVHPADRERAIANRNKTLAEESTDDNEYRYLVNGKEKVIWSRGTIFHKNGRKVLIGTVMDVTSRHEMVRELLQSRDRYQQAQQIAHIGNWNRNLETNVCTWTDELYRIYDLEPRPDHLRPEITREYRHPDDIAMYDEHMQLLRDVHIPCDFNFRIILPDGQLKHLNVKADIGRNEEGKVVRTFGTVQDITEKQLLIDQLRESEALYKQAQELSHIGNWEWNLLSGKIHWSDELYRIYGLSPGTELSFDQIMAFNRPGDNENIRQKLKACKETFQPSETYYHIILEDGTEKVLHAKTETLAEDGKAYKMGGTIQDVTEKQLLIERLQESDKLFRQAQEISRIGNWSWDMETKKLEWSDELYRIYELEPQSIDTSPTIGLYNHPEDEAIIRDTIKASLENQKPFDFNYRIILKQGRVKTLNARGEVKRREDGQPGMIFGTVQDVTEQKNVERQLKDYHEFVEKITDVTPSIIAAYNIHSGQFFFINDAIEKLLGYSSAKVMEEGAAFMASIVHPDDIQALMEKNNRALEEANLLADTDTEPIVEFKYRMLNKRGEYRWFHTYGTIFERDASGQVVSVLNISVDITAQEETEQALYRKNLLLQQSNTSLEEYAYVASHDLKEPLRKISTFSDRLLNSQQIVLNEDGKIYLDKIAAAANRMQKMINDLLSVATILGNKAYEPADLNVLMSEAIQPLDHKIEEMGAVIEVDALPELEVVPSQFRQLFQNLIGNALKFARPDTQLLIKITHKIIGQKAGEQFGLTKAKNYLQIEIEDNGIGFDNQYAGKIFAIFQRLHGKSEYEGTGIGLAICKKIVENHNGVIFAKGMPGIGTIFTIVIPM